jgi:hypothetical protein
MALFFVVGYNVKVKIFCKLKVRFCGLSIGQREPEICLRLFFIRPCPSEIFAIAILLSTAIVVSDW